MKFAQFSLKTISLETFSEGETTTILIKKCWDRFISMFTMSAVVFSYRTAPGAIKDHVKVIHSPKCFGLKPTYTILSVWKRRGVFWYLVLQENEGILQFVSTTFVHCAMVAPWSVFPNNTALQMSPASACWWTAQQGVERTNHKVTILFHSTAYFKKSRQPRIGRR